MGRVLLLGILWMLEGPAGQVGELIVNGGFEHDDRAPAGWKILNARTGKLSVSIVSEGSFEGQRCLKVALQPDVPYISSISQKLPEIAANHTIVLSFRYKAEGTVPLHLNLTGGPICEDPWVRHRFSLERDGTWHEEEAQFHARRLAPGRTWVEFVIEGTLKKAAALYLDSVKASAVPTPPFRLISPQSGILFDRLDDPMVLFAGSSGPDPSDLGAELRSRDGSWKKPLKIEAAGPTLFKAAMPDDAAVGEYELKVTDRGRRAETVFPLSKMRLRTPYCVIHDGIPYVDEKPFLIIGLYHMGDRVLGIINEENKKMEMPAVGRREMLQSVAKRGFNTVHFSWGMPGEDYLREARESGLKVIPETLCNSKKTQDLGQDDTVLFWYTLDEPHPTKGRFLQKRYHESRRNDPFRPVYTALEITDLQGLSDIEFCDVPSPDEYPIGAPTSDLTQTFERVDSVHRILIGADPRKSCLFIPQLFTMTAAPQHNFELTYEQVRCQTYIGIIAGARGIIYYGYYTHEKLEPGMSRNPSRKHWYLPESALWDRIGDLNKELVSLKEPILSSKTSNAVSVSGKARALVREAGGKIYVFVANGTAEEVPLSLQCRSDKLRFRPFFDSTPAFPQAAQPCTLGRYQVAVWEGDGPAKPPTSK